jgi:hypothetical protein
VESVPVNDPGILADVDTPEDYQRVLEQTPPDRRSGSRGGQEP